MGVSSPQQDVVALKHVLTGLGIEESWQRESVDSYEAPSRLAADHVLVLRVVLQNVGVQFFFFFLGGGE